MSDKTRKIIIANGYEGFRISPEALLWLNERDLTLVSVPLEKYYILDSEFGKSNKNADLRRWKKYLSGNRNDDPKDIIVFNKEETHVLLDCNISRDHALLIECFYELGSKFNLTSNITNKIVEIPEDVKWKVIEGSSGKEMIVENHRVWE